MEFSPVSFNTTDDADLANVLKSPLFNLLDDSLINMFVFLSNVEAASYLNVYQTSVLGQPITLLASYSSNVSDNYWLCLPAGLYQLAFIAFALPDDFIALRDVDVTEKPCIYTPLQQYGK